MYYYHIDLCISVVDPGGFWKLVRDSSRTIDLCKLFCHYFLMHIGDKTQSHLPIWLVKHSEAVLFKEFYYGLKN